MSYGQNNIILADDFNQRATAINNLWGTGAGSNGYGQSSTISSNSIGAVVPATDWATVVNRLNSITQHQTGAGAGLSAPSSGSIITYLAGIDTAINNAITNKLTSFSTGSNVGVQYGSTTSWFRTATKTFTIAFGSDNQARYFFNSGGSIALVANACSITPTSWNSFVVTGLNAVVLKSGSFIHTGTVGTYTRNVYVSGSGFTSLTSTPTTFLDLTETGTGNTNYNNNVARVQLSYNGTGTITASMILYDNDTNAFGYTNTGNVVARIDTTNPEVTYITNTWGSLTITNTVNTQA